MRMFLLMISLLGCAFLKAQEVSQITLSADASRVLELSAKEVQKYVYLRTGRFIPISSDESISPAIVLERDSLLSEEEYSIGKERGDLFIRGGSDVAVLYGAYSYAEYLGVRFALHSDIIPDKPFVGSLLDCEQANVKPLFAIRGLLPFHDFPEGPDLWDEDMYKSCVAQMVKMKMNFFSLHTYPHVEPNVWIGLPEDVMPDGRVSYSYPTTLANTMRNGAWGYSAMSTEKYSAGASSLFGDSVYMSPVLDKACPWPRTLEEMNGVFNRTGEMFNHVFSFGRDLGVKSCVGLETPLSIPKEVAERLRRKGIDPSGEEAVSLLYEGIFKRISRTHPLDFFWLWTPENWTWGNPSEESIKETIADIRIAREVLRNDFDSIGFGTGVYLIASYPNRISCLR